MHRMATLKNTPLKCIRVALLKLSSQHIKKIIKAYNERPTIIQKLKTSGTR